MDDEQMRIPQEDELKELEENIKLYDKDGDSLISLEEAGNFWRTISHGITMAQIKENFNAIDVDGTGYVPVEKFVQFTSENPIAKKDGSYQMKQAFRVFDRDGTGTISLQELKRIMMHIGDEPLSEEEAERLFSQLDSDGNEELNYDEFIELAFPEDKIQEYIDDQLEDQFQEY